MKIIETFTYQELVRQTSANGKRHYIDPLGNMVSSVTTILSATSDQTNILKWKERVGLDEANRIRDEAFALGTLMHTHLECHVCDIPRPSGNNFIRRLASNMADQIIERGLINLDEVWGMEVALYYPGLFAGTTDLCGVHKGSPAIIDYKTSSKMKSRSFIDDYFMQVCAYAMCHNEVYATNIKKGVIFMVDRDLNFKEFVLEGDEFDEYTKKWIGRLETFLNLQD